MSVDLDDIDAKILILIQEDAGLSVADIAEKVGLSSSPCWRRIKRLEERGVIHRRVTILDRKKVGLDFEVYASVKLTLPTKDNLDLFEKHMAVLPEIMECAAIAGDEDYVLRIITADMHAYDEFLRDKILTLGIVGEVRSRIVVRSVKDTSALPLAASEIAPAARAAE